MLHLVFALQIVLSHSCEVRVKTQALYHVKEVSDLGSSAEVPDKDVPIVPSREHDPPVERVGFQHKHLVIMTLRRSEPVRPNNPTNNQRLENLLA